MGARIVAQSAWEGPLSLTRAVELVIPHQPRGYYRRVMLLTPMYRGETPKNGRFIEGGEAIPVIGFTMK